jgi:hypothetical protein
VDIITGAGPGGLPQVKVFDWQTLTEIGTFFAYSSAFDGGVFVGGMTDTLPPSITVVPEPASVVLLLWAVPGLLAAGHRRSR